MDKIVKRIWSGMVGLVLPVFLIVLSILLVIWLIGMFKWLAILIMVIMISYLYGWQIEVDRK